MTEKLVAVAIVRNSIVHSGGFREHYRIRAMLGDVDPFNRKLTDTEGFLTSEDRFVDREEAGKIAAAAGQCRPMNRPLLSSDVNW